MTQRMQRNTVAALVMMFLVIIIIVVDEPNASHSSGCDDHIGTPVLREEVAQDSVAPPVENHSGPATQKEEEYDGVDLLIDGAAILGAGYTIYDIFLK